MTTVAQLITLLSGYNPDSVITNEQLENFVHIRTLDDQVILSTKRPIAYCNRTGEKVYPSLIYGYYAYSPELDEDLLQSETTPLEPYKVVFDGEETEYFQSLEDMEEEINNTSFDIKIEKFELNCFFEYEPIY